MPESDRPAGTAQATSDREDRLIHADPAIAALQRGCGGELPGTIAIPALLALVRKARGQRLRLARSLTVLDDGQPLTCWAQIEPADEGARITLSHWRAAGTPPRAAIEPAADGERELWRQIADGYALLDPDQRVLHAVMAAPALKPLEAALRDAGTRPWTDCVTVDDGGHRQPMHWRLLDGARIAVPGVDGAWRARLAPLASGGFELLLVPESIAALPHEPAAAAADEGAAADMQALLGREFGPALKQPINRIIANAETIRTRMAGPLADEYAQYAADIADAARHLLDLVDDLADLEAVEAPGFAPAPDRIELGDCARRAAGILSVRAGQRNIVLEAPPREPAVPAIGEFRRVLQVLLNLVGNAIAYSGEGTRVRLTCGGDGARAWLAVEDEGPGLTPEQAAKAFDKFERLGRGGDGGSGLGLFISRKLARAMGGDLTVASTPGEGARFVLELPPDPQG